MKYSAILYPYEALNHGQGSCFRLHAKHAAMCSAIYTLNVSILVVLIYTWRVSTNIKKADEFQDVYYETTRDAQPGKVAGQRSNDVLMGLSANRIPSTKL
ncbi:hypothetical protein M8J77_014847 [Diaphorina citri]|nr:hypothetical protein M8J77_014847 [Diaphorina citri]